MSGKDWKDYEPAPLEFFQQRVNQMFLAFKAQQTSGSMVRMNQQDFDNIFTAAKAETEKKYPTHILPIESIPKSEFKKA
ncbi:MAG: hypothetical protein ACPGU4_13765 [Flavobacteriales bacterium]